MNRDLELALLSQAYARKDKVVRWRGQAFIAGTSSLRDVVADVAAFFGVNPTYVRKVPPSERYVGHSLGGLVAAYLSRKTGKPSKAFGPYALPWLPHATVEDALDHDPVAIFSRRHHFGVGHSLDSYSKYSM